MRRLWMVLMVLGLAGMVAGCHHTCGICDCDWNHDPCAYYTPYCNMNVTPSSYHNPYYTSERLTSSYNELPPPVQLLPPLRNAGW